MKTYAVTYRGTAVMVVVVEADSAREARAKAEEGDYEVASDVEFVWGKPYTMKTKVWAGEAIA